jgi:hypothetical protein
MNGGINLSILGLINAYTMKNTEILKHESETDPRVTVTNDFKLSEQCAKFAGLDFY